MSNGETHPTDDEYKIDVYQLTNEINWFTGKSKIKGDIWLKRKDGKRGKDPKIEILAKGKCSEQKKKVLICNTYRFNYKKLFSSYMIRNLFSHHYGRGVCVAAYQGWH